MRNDIERHAQLVVVFIELGELVVGIHLTGVDALSRLSEFPATEDRLRGFGAGKRVFPFDPVSVPYFSIHGVGYQNVNGTSNVSVTENITVRILHFVLIDRITIEVGGAVLVMHENLHDPEVGEIVRYLVAFFFAEII